MDNKELTYLAQSINDVDLEDSLKQRNSLKMIYRQEVTNIPIKSHSFMSETPLTTDSVDQLINDLKLSKLYIPNNRDRTDFDEVILINKKTLTSLKVYKSYGGRYDYSLTTFCSKEIDRFIEFSAGRTEAKMTNIHMVTCSPSGWEMTHMGAGGKSLIRENYEKDVLASFDYITEAFSSPDPMGRLVILHGEPGTGKTFFIRGLLNSVKGTKSLLIPARHAVKLEDPELLTMLIEENNRVRTSEDFEEKMKRGANEPKKATPLLLIIEDADQILTNRDQGNTSSISSLLNMTDGIFGSLVDIRIIATTNAKTVDIDSALLRPGRLLEKIGIGALKIDTANKVYKRLTDKTGGYTKSITLSEIYADAGNFKNKKIKTDKRNKIGF